MLELWTRRNGKPQAVCPDNAGEFISKEFIAYCVRNSIAIIPRAPYDHQAGGIIERGVQSSQADSRALLLEADLPLQKGRAVVPHYLPLPKNYLHHAKICAQNYLKMDAENYLKNCKRCLRMSLKNYLVLAQPIKPMLQNFICENYPRSAFSNDAITQL